MPQIKLSKINKNFGNIQVLKDVELELEPGEIHGLVGANGSGKSTLLNILFGNPVIRNTGSYSGSILISGQPVQLRSASEAVRYGIGMIHQEFALISGLTIAENIKLGREKARGITEKLLGYDLSYVDRESNIQDAKAAMEKLGMEIDPRILVLDLSISMKQFTEIAREIDKTDLKLLLLDEPTAVLNKEDSRMLMDVLRTLAQKGISMLFVSHRLEEIMEICDRVTVLRDGAVISHYRSHEFEGIQIAQDMLGKEIIQAMQKKSAPLREPIMEFKNFGAAMPGERLDDLNIEIYKGEILGITALSGHGKLAIGNGVMGIYDNWGSVKRKGTPLENSNIREMISRGICFISEDRRGKGLLLKHSILENIVFTAMMAKDGFLHPFPLSDLRWPDRNLSSVFAAECIRELSIKCESAQQKVEELSGGNQQKVCIARALALNPEILFISEPTRGIDLGAKEIVLNILVSLNKKKGTTIVIASSELDELQRICDRIVVLYEGRVSAVLSPEDDERKFALALSGESVDQIA